MVLGRRFYLWGVPIGVSLALVVGLWLLGEAPRSTGISEQASLQEGVQVQLTRSAPGAEQAVLQEGVDVSRHGADQAPPPGGEQSTIREGLEFIIRDASGRVKGEGKGQ